MKNYHQDSKLITSEEISKIENAFQSAWCKNTADPIETKNWSIKNKALGQCAVTSVIIYDLFGGRMIYDKENFHIWNEFPDESQHDFSRTQFLEDKIFSIYKYKTKEDILFDERGKATNILERYKLLKQRFNNFWKKL